MNIAKTCPMCNIALAFELSDDEFVAFNQKNRGHIQDILPQLHKVEREFLITGYCPDCQSLIFGSTYKMNSRWIDLSTLV